MPQGLRRLAAIMFTDMVGYTALGQKNEELSLALVDEQRKLVRQIIGRHNGREVKTVGDAFLIEFPNALDAARCAYDIQRAAREYNISEPESNRIHLRIGIHLGDIVSDGEDVSGDAVNVASRIEPLAQDGGVCLSRQVYDHVEHRFELRFASLGLKALKNVDRPMEVFAMQMPWEATPPSEVSVPRNRLAVLPFGNMSPDPNDEYFADGMTDEIISALSKIQGLEVISRTSVIQYRKNPRTAREVSKDLNVGSIVEGSVRKSGDKIRVTVQMIDATKDVHLWAESYDRDLRDVFAIQSDIAKNVSEALKIQLLPSEKKDIERRPTTNLGAYQLCLEGHYHILRETREECMKGLQCFERAIELDPRCAIAYAGISDYYHIGSHYNWYKPEDSFPMMKEYAKKAVEIDPRLPEAHAALGAAYFHFEWKWKDAEEELLRAMELKPNYEFAHEMYSYLLGILGRFEESSQHAHRAASLGYLSTGMGLGGALRILAGGQEISKLEDIVRIRPDLPLAHDTLGFAYHSAGRPEDAFSEIEKAIFLSKEDPVFKADKALLLAFDGRRDESEAILSELVEASRRSYVSDVQLGCILFTLGRDAEAFEHLERAYERRAIDLTDIRLMSGMQRLRSDPRWASIELRMGLAPLGRANRPG